MVTTSKNLGYLPLAKPVRQTGRWKGRQTNWQTKLQYWTTYLYTAYRAVFRNFILDLSILIIYCTRLSILPWSRQNRQPTVWVQSSLFLLLHLTDQLLFPRLKTRVFMGKHLPIKMRLIHLWIHTHFAFNVKHQPMTRGTWEIHNVPPPNHSVYCCAINWCQWTYISFHVTLSVWYEEASTWKNVSKLSSNSF